MVVDALIVHTVRQQRATSSIFAEINYISCSKIFIKGEAA
jgi:hypothetical protein